MSRLALVALVVGAVATASGCGAASRATKTSTGPRQTLTDLHDIGQLQAAFAKASGRPRLIVLVSPT
jgi:hypothetical protein